MLNEKNKCCGCAACVNVCPRQCISMVSDEEGFLYPVVEQKKCIACGMCEKVCPIIKEKQSKDTFLKTYIAYNFFEQIRQHSSSGGVFCSLAQKVLSERGIVYGAIMSSDCRRVQHVKITNEKDISALQGSKYLQSEINLTYKEIENGLKIGDRILFSGTPCQVEGLKSFLGREYDNLFLVDIVCHGVPSQKVWEKYISEIEHKKKAKAQNVSFRDKSYGWRMYSLCIRFDNNRVYRKIFKDDLFGQALLQNICLRPSCHNCEFKTINRNSDITLADAWNVGKNIRDDDKGKSLVLVHSQKGEKMINDISCAINLVEVESEEVIKKNTPIYLSSKENSCRADFFCEIDVIPISELLKKYVNTKKTFKWKLRRLYKQMEYWFIQVKGVK